MKNEQTGHDQISRAGWKGTAKARSTEKSYLRHFIFSQ